MYIVTFISTLIKIIFFKKQNKQTKQTPKKPTNPSQSQVFHNNQFLLKENIWE